MPYIALDTRDIEINIFFLFFHKKKKKKNNKTYVVDTLGASDE